MKIYCVRYENTNDYEGDKGLVGIFSSPLKAAQYILDGTKSKKSAESVAALGFYKYSKSEYFNIEEWEIDEPSHVIDMSRNDSALPIGTTFMNSVVHR